MKRILSLDGGGIRGIFALQVLARIEALLREESGRADLRLADVFDLIAGTSTGAIIAAFLSWGKTVAEIERLYVDAGPLMFRRQPWYRRWRSKYRAEAIAEFFKGQFREDAGGAALMGSQRLKTKLLIVMRNATTGSPWPVTNNPGAFFNDAGREDCNLDIPLWQLLRASTAAPSFFPPECIAYGSQRFLFVDGAVTPYNNPALIAVLTATLPQYRLCWPTGRQALHVISVGTGYTNPRLPPKVAEKINLKDQWDFVLPALLDAVTLEQDMICRLIGDCVFGDAIDQEIGDLNAVSLLHPGEQKFSYVRYNRALRAKSGPLRGEVPLDMHMDRIANLTRFKQVGEEYAQATVRMQHLYPRLG